MKFNEVQAPKYSSKSPIARERRQSHQAQAKVPKSDLAEVKAGKPKPK
jgi:hypothetical protein